MTTSIQTPIAGDEPLVDAAEASFILNLPRYLMTSVDLREKHCIPHYRIGRQVRFKLSELAAWQQATHRTREASHE